MVKQVNDMAEFKALINSDNLVVVDFFATWCGPCLMIAPKIDELDKANADVTFIKVDVDAAEDIAMDQKISAMPTFKFFKNGKKVGEVVGADYDKIVATLNQNK